MNAPKGEGSVWNVNNWHWEQKNYSKEAEEILRNKFSGFNFQRDDIKFSVKKLVKV